MRVDYLSRARKPKEVKQILADLEQGKIDIIIGTHKLIGKAVKFKDLGLLVVDEEQKFGVSVKEKLKQLKVNVDTLTMSATPIPRTLQFSLMGARDLSAITTPPANRYPILTSLGTLNDDVMAEAINYELSRNGQVFIVNNRVEQLYNLENMVRRLVPDARVVVGHGQLPPDKLEQVIIDFANHDYDVLIATTIIESGLDMPNVNTIIINNACWCPPENRSPPWRAGGCRPSRVSATWGPASTLPCKTSTSAGPAICWVLSKADLSPTWATRPTKKSSGKPFWNSKPKNLPTPLPNRRLKHRSQPASRLSTSPIAPSTPTSN